MKLRLLDGGEDGEYSVLGCVEILKVFAVQDVVFLWNRVI